MTVPCLTPVAADSRIAGMGAWPRRRSGSVRLRKNAPNGVACGPVCYQANVTVHPNGTLTVNPG